MTYLAILTASLVLFVAFVALTIVEARVGSRVLAGPRGRLDKFSGRLFLIVQHVNWSEFIAHLVQSVAARVAHDVAFFSLAVVRFIERQLTYIVRSLRDRKPNVLAPKPSRRPILEQTGAYLNRITRRREKNPYRDDTDPIESSSFTTDE